MLAASLLAIAIGIASWWFLPREDPKDYGQFADSIFLNVVSNAGFLIVGGAGLLLRRNDAAAKTLFIGVILTAFGSAYFHADPLDAAGDLNRFTLLWDRLPMTIAFAGFLALVLHDRVGVSRWTLPLLAVIGIATVVWWYVTNDLFPYALFQLFAPVGTLILITVLQPRFTEAGYLAAGVFLFGIAKVFEALDDAIAKLGPIGGHPLKHVAGALAALMILLWLVKRHDTIEGD